MSVLVISNCKNERVGANLTVGIHLNAASWLGNGDAIYHLKALR